MYDEPEALAVPDTWSPECIEGLAAAGIYIHIKKKVKRKGDDLRLNIQSYFSYTSRRKHILFNDQYPLQE